MCKDFTKKIIKMKDNKGGLKIEKFTIVLQETHYHWDIISSQIDL